MLDIIIKKKFHLLTKYDVYITQTLYKHTCTFERRNNIINIQHYGTYNLFH